MRACGYILEYRTEGKEPATATKILQEELTENEAAIYIVCQAAKRFNGKPTEVEIYTPSQWFSCAAEKWLPTWRENDYKGAGGREIKYRELWEEYWIFREKYHPKIFANRSTEYTRWLEGEVNARENHRDSEGTRT
jgi:ribonuclease HI